MCKTLIDARSWDEYDLDSLLPLKETYRENTEFGFLLRHYWIPATELRFRQSSLLTASDGREERRELRIDRRMARCRSNECTWREKVYDVASTNGNVSGEEPTLLSEMLCSYDCYDQAYVCNKPILFELPKKDEKLEARRRAIYRLPMLCPPGPNPIGFIWHAKVGDDYMNYRLDAEEHIGTTSVLVIRREGRYTVWHSKERKKHRKEKPIRVVRLRKGVTLFAWNRGAVLEDRFFDRVIEADEDSDLYLGTTSQVVTRLIRSCPEDFDSSASRSCAAGAEEQTVSS